MSIWKIILKDCRISLAKIIKDRATKVSVPIIGKVTHKQGFRSRVPAKKKAFPDQYSQR